MEQLNEERRLRRGLGMGSACGLPRLRFFFGGRRKRRSCPLNEERGQPLSSPFSGSFLPAAEDRDDKMPMDRKKPKGQIQRTCPFGYKIRGKMMSKIQETPAAEPRNPDCVLIIPPCEKNVKRLLVNF